jgi:hypothetical protein
VESERPSKFVRAGGSVQARPTSCSGLLAIPELKRTLCDATDREVVALAVALHGPRYTAAAENGHEHAPRWLDTDDSGCSTCAMMLLPSKRRGR